MSTVISNELQLGQDSVTPSNNFVIGTPTPADGRLIISQGISGNNTPIATLYANGSLSVTSLTANNFTFPSSDGTADQFLQTDGSGNLSFVDFPTGKAIAMAIVFG